VRRSVGGHRRLPPRLGVVWGAPRASCVCVVLTEQIFTTDEPREVVDALLQPTAADRVYVGGGLFTNEEKDFHLRLTHELERLGFSVFLPQRDGFEAAALIDWSEDEKVRRIYQRDLLEVCQARFLFANLDGAIPDDGVCAEVAIAGMHKLINREKRIIGYRSDTRTFMGTMPLNPLVAGPLDLLCGSREEVIEYFTRHAPLRGAAAPGG
jgi:nucleoside 2-deoxyribosyltransferase